MPYKIRFRRRAKQELVLAQSYSAEFGEQLNQWLIDIAVSIVPGKKDFAIDMTVVLEAGIDLIPEGTSPWKTSWSRFCTAGHLEKLRALVALVKKRRPPWELQTTSRWFPQILNAFDCEAHAVFEVNHVDGEVIFTMFAGLPGQDC